MTPLPAQGVPWIVLDTNVVLDWLVFDEPHASEVGAQIRQGALQWIRTAAMAAELHRVLGYDAVQRRGCQTDAIEQTANALSREFPGPPPLPFAQQLRCSDADDQGFIDLAIAHRVPWLLSRDKAVLKLARRARTWGVQVLTPQRWQVSAGVKAQVTDATDATRATGAPSPVA